MTDKGLESRIERLDRSSRDEFDRKVEQEEERLRKELQDEYREKVKNEIQTNQEEIGDFNIVISAFEVDDRVEYSYIRTEPLFHEKEHNLDVLIAHRGEGIAIFIECERRLSSRLESKLINYIEKVEVIEEDLAEGIDIDEYLEETIGDTPRTNEFVMASRQLPEIPIKDKVEELEINLIAWNLAHPGRLCRIYQTVFKKTVEEPFSGHCDDDLNKYIDKVLEAGVPFQQYVDFTYSSSNYLKLRDMALTIVERHHRQGHKNFDHIEWCELFKYEIKNYHEEEKETLYRNFIDYGVDCGIVSLDEDADEWDKKRYRIIHSSEKNTGSLIDEFETKIAEFEMQGEFNDRMDDFKEQLVTQIERDKATGGTTLSDFVEK